MKTLTGITASSGSALGPFFLFQKSIPVPDSLPSQFSQEQEINNLDIAVKRVGADLEKRATNSSGEVRDILIATAEIATDPAITEEAAIFIADGRTASYALYKSVEVFAESLSNSDSYLAERVNDLENIRDRILCELAHVPYPEIPQFELPTILIAQDLSPADTSDLKAEKILAIVTAAGGPTSHAAIIARSRGIAAIVACRGVVDEAIQSIGSLIAVDTRSGRVIFNPDDLTQSHLTNQIERTRARKSGLISRTSKGYTTTDGTVIPIYANIARAEEASAAVQAGADGVGLLRTELLYLNKQVAPSIEEQSEIYFQLLSSFPGKRVIIRTLDAGADKPLAFINFNKESNPALGVRGYRTSVEHEEILHNQLQAIAEAAEKVTADVWVMAPMITFPAEAKEFVELARRYGLRKAGVMIEVPSMVFYANEITKICDFVSIGTNDLGQYIHAADRESSALASYNDPWQPALLRAIQQVTKAGQKNNCPVGVCGEAASDPALAGVLVGLGVSSISCSVPTLANVVQFFTAHSLAQLREAGNVALDTETAEQAKSQARLQLPELERLAL